MATATESVPIRVNCGGPAVDGLSADQRYVPGSWGYDVGTPWSIRHSILNPDKRIRNDFGFPHGLDTVRFHVGAPIHYLFDVPDGSYTVKLYFVEVLHRTAGARVFDVKANGEPRLRGVDIVKEAGDRNTGLEKVLTGVPVTDGRLELEFTTVHDCPAVSVIVVEREAGRVPPPRPSRPLVTVTSDGLHRIDHDHEGLVGYHGAWSKTPGSHRSEVQGSAAYLTFTGTLIRWIGSKGPDRGIAAVSVDGKPQPGVDAWAPSERAGEVLFEMRGLSAERYHTVKVTVGRERNPASTGCAQDIAGFECERVPETARETADAAYAELAAIMAGRKPSPKVASWRPVAYATSAPRTGVSLEGGVLHAAVERNARYIRDCWAASDWIIGEHRAWVPWLPGSNEGRMLSGAGHLARWNGYEAMRGIVDAIVDAIGARQREDGYALPYPDTDLACLPSEMDERRAYDRAMWTRGLMAASLTGNEKASQILRRFCDWFNRSPYVPAMLEGSLGYQGHVASTLVGLAPFGKPEDLTVAERSYVQDWMLERLSREDPRCVYQYPLNRPHSYIVVLFEAYLDHYRATGESRFLDAARGAWKVYHDNFVHVGGSAAICEGGYGVYAPQSYLLSAHTGEHCGSVFWIDFNHRLLQLFPEEERYANEIERSICNVTLANQEANGAIRYHTNLHGKKDDGTRHNTCCENTATGLYSRLPQYVYSVADDGVFVNLFEPSTLSWERDGRPVSIRMGARFPAGREVSLVIDGDEPQRMSLRIRVPSWAAADVEFLVNGVRAAVGTPGTYAILERQWRKGDRVDFSLPVGFRLRRYEGIDQVQGHDRFSLEYGPVLMALAGPSDDACRQPNGEACPRLRIAPSDLVGALQPVAGRPLHFTVGGHPNHRYLPYAEVDRELFSCFPVIGD